MNCTNHIIGGISDSIPAISSASEAVIKESKTWWTNIDTSIIISIVVFFGGFLITILIEKNKKRKELEIYKTLIVEWVKVSKSNIDQYIRSLGEFSNRVKNSDSFNIELYHTNLLCIEKLNSLPIEKLTDALLINLSVKKNEISAVSQLYSLINQLEFLDKNANQVTLIYDKYCKENDILLNEWNDHYLDLTKNVAENYNDQDTPEIYHKFYEFSMLKQKKIIDFQKQNAIDHNNLVLCRSKFMNEFINPVYQYGLDNSQHLVKSANIQKTMTMLNELKIVNQKYDTHSEYGEVFEVMNNSMIDSRKILFASIDYYDNHDIKSFWKIK
jgi:hypothetical protein